MRQTEQKNIAMAIQIPHLNLPFLRSKETFAVDIGFSSVKIIQLKPSGSKYSLEKYALIPLSDMRPEMAPQERKNGIVALLAEYCAKEKIMSQNVVTSISGNQVIVRYVRFPKLTPEELSKTVQFEAEPYIPFDIRDVDLSFHILGDVVEEGQKKMDAILVAAKKEVAQGRLEILNELKLRTVCIDIDAFALSNAYEMDMDPSVSETALLINIGATTTTMSIVEKYVPRVVRDIYVAGNSFTKAVQKGLGCDLKNAEDLKMRYGLLVTAEEKEKTLAENKKEALQVSQALMPVAKEFLGEIQRSVDFYISQNTERGIGRILLCGGSANLKNLDKLLHQELKVPVEKFNPMKNIEGGDQIPDEVAMQYAVAVGLALRRENDLQK
jgi:type IV pilus assembly protein PilM